MSREKTVKKDVVIFKALSAIEKLCKSDTELNEYYIAIKFAEELKVKAIDFYLSQKYIISIGDLPIETQKLIGNIRFYSDFLSLFPQEENEIIINRYELLLLSCHAIDEMGRTFKPLKKFFKEGLKEAFINNDIFQNWKKQFPEGVVWDDVENNLLKIIFEIAHYLTEVAQDEKCTKQFNECRYNFGFYSSILFHNKVGLW